MLLWRDSCVQVAMCLFPETLLPLLDKAREHESGKKAWVEALAVLK